MGSTLPAHLRNGRPVGEAQHVVVVLLGVLRVAAGVRAAQDRDRAPLAEEVAQRVRQLGRLGERADEDEIEIGRQLLEQILHPGVTDEVDVVSFLLTPDSHHLGHDAGQVGIHDPAIQRRIALRYEIKNADAQSAHEQSSDAGDGPRPVGCQ